MEEQILTKMREAGLEVLASGTTGTTGGSTSGSLNSGQSGLQQTVEDNLPHTDPGKAIDNILNAAYGIAGVVAVGFIIWAGVTYTTSQGDPGKTKNALHVLIYALVGLAVVLLAAFITNFVIGNVNA